MKKFFVFALIILSASISINAQFTLNYGVRIESKAYAPVNGVVLNDNPVCILNAVVHSGGTSLSYWKSISVYDTKGDYDGWFLIHPFSVLSQKLKAKVIHFADYSFEKKGLSVIGLQAYGGADLCWSLEIDNLIYHDRSPRLVVRPSIRHKSVSLNMWIYHEFDETSFSAGFSWQSKRVEVSKSVAFSTQLVVNESITKRINPESSAFGQQATVALALSFAFQ